jgi:hypothetical protein
MTSIEEFCGQILIGTISRLSADRALMAFHDFSSAQRALNWKPHINDYKSNYIYFNILGMSVSVIVIRMLYDVSRFYRI